MSTKVFISYSHSDSRWVNEFARALRDRDVKVWTDEEDIKPGDDWKGAIGKALRGSDAIIVVVSDAYAENPDLYFDVGVAFAADKPLILVVDPSAATSLPDFRRRQVALQEPEETAREVAEAISAPG